MTIAPRPCALCLEIDPDPQEFRRASSWLRAGGASLGVPNEQVDRLELCLNEVLANLVEHGGDAVASHTIQLELGVSPVPGSACSCRYPAGLLAGINPQASYRSETAQLNHSDLLFADTDGLSEAEDDKGRAFAIEPCRVLLIQRSRAPLPVILDGVRDALTSFCGSGALEDDCTLLLLRIP